MRRRLCAIAALIGLVAATLGQTGASAQNGPPETPDLIRGYSIVPPGQDGNVNAVQFATGDFGPHYADQLEMYVNLVTEKRVSAKDLDEYFHDMQFGPGESIARTYSPIGGATVYRDDLGIPHIYADSLETASFALGYVTAEDRLFQMDVFRHAARGTLTEFVGAGDDDEFLKMDIETRQHGYTEAEIQEMWTEVVERFGENGDAAQKGLDQYTAGVNEYVDRLKTDPAYFPDRPVEYEASLAPFPEFPTPWLTEDTLFLVVLQLRVFGETAGFELENAGLFAHLRERLGKKLGAKVYDDLLFQEDRRSPTTIAKGEASFHTQRLGKLEKKSRAIPDDAVDLALELMGEAAVVDSASDSVGFHGGPSSNALVVSARESATGNPLLYGAPQVGYSVPQFFLDVDVHAPGVDFRGPAVPGASALIPLGRGADYAWTLTTGFSDAVDTIAEKLCEPDGSEPTKDSTHYLFNGECREMESRTETFVVKPTPSYPSEPRVIEKTFYRTVHGPVFAYGTIRGEPVAFVKQRFFWTRELDSIIPFYEWNTQIDEIGDFAKAAENFTMSFNAFYADSEHIGYFHVGEYPKRPKGVSPSLPRWGTGEWEWRGRRPFSKQPQIVDPDQGWVANWNNKPVRGWTHYDDFKWGSVQRVQLVSDGLHEVLDGKGKAKLHDLADVAAYAATRDVRGVYLGPTMLKKVFTRHGHVISVPVELGEVHNILNRWIESGAHRTNADGDGTMDEGAALPLFDRWYEKLVHRIFDDELGETGFTLMAGEGDSTRAPISDYDPFSEVNDDGSSFFFDFSSYLRNLFKKKTRAAYVRNYCDDMDTKKKESCRDQTQKALSEALRELEEEQGEDMEQWSNPAETIYFLELGAGSVEDISWQNRGTHNHLVEILSDL